MRQFGLVTFLALSVLLLAAPNPSFARGVVEGVNSILVISPHPDDETLCCGGLIHQARKKGIKVAIVWVTNGDGFYRDAMEIFEQLPLNPKFFRSLGQMRMNEAEQAALLLGVDEDSMYFLGFPDRGLEDLTLYYLKPYTSPTTRWRSVQYEGAYRVGVEYSGKNLKELLVEILRRVNPDMVLLPSPLDTHSDHKFAGVFALDALFATGYRGKICHWIVHADYDWPKWWGSQLLPPAGTKGYGWLRFPLRPDDLKAKTEAVKTYKTQLLVMEFFLKLFLRKNEIYYCD